MHSFKTTLHARDISSIPRFALLWGFQTCRNLLQFEHTQNIQGGTYGFT